MNLILLFAPNSLHTKTQ